LKTKNNWIGAYSYYLPLIRNSHSERI